MTATWQGKPLVFVFGSNLSGVHGRGAAKHAHKRCGARWGVGQGPTGQAYALPTKGRYPQLPVLPLHEVAAHAQAFLHYAAANPQLLFQLTAVGCGLAGYSAAQVAPLFSNPPANVLLPPEWLGCYPPEHPAQHWSAADLGPEAAPASLQGQ